MLACMMMEIAEKIPEKKIAEKRLAHIHRMSILDHEL
jgi:hypothetical protein